MNVHDAAAHDTPRYYYHGVSGMLLDVNEGMFKFDATTYCMVLVEPLRQRVLAHLLAHEKPTGYQQRTAAARLAGALRQPTIGRGGYL